VNPRSTTTQNTATQRTRVPSRRIAVLRALGIGFAASTTIGIGVALAGPVAADPPREPFTLQCDLLGEVSIAVPAGGPYTPGLVVGDTRVGLPYAFSSTYTYTQPGGEPEATTYAYSKPAPAHDRKDRCTWHEEGSDELGAYTVDGEVLITYTPR
jgi:hypothetical protein